MGSADKNFIKGRDLKLGHILMIHRDFQRPGETDNRPPSFVTWTTFNGVVNFHLVAGAKLLPPDQWLASTKRVNDRVFDWLSSLHHDELPEIHLLCRQDTPDV